MKKKVLSVISMVMVLLTVVSVCVAGNAFAAEQITIDAPEFKSITSTCTSVTIEWEEYEDDDMRFLVYRSTTGKAGTWTKLVTTAAGATSYKDITVTPSKTYYYTVKAYYKAADGTVYLSPMSGKHVIKTTLEKPVFSLAGNSGDGVLFKWDARSDVTGFILYKSTTGQAGSWTRLGSVIQSNKAGSYTDTRVTIGQTYYYCIKAYKVIGGKEYYSPSSKAYKLVIKDVAVPTNLKAEATEEGVLFSFDKVLATKGYIIYRSETGVAGSWTKLTTTTSNNKTSYLDKTAEIGKVYYYTVKSYKKVNGEPRYSGSARAIRITNLVIVPEITISPANEVSFSDYYEKISVTIKVKNFEEDDKIKIYVDSTEITDALAEDETAMNDFLAQTAFFFEIDEDNTTDEKLVLDLYRIAPGEGTLKIVHEKYDDIYAQLKVKSPVLTYDEDLEAAWKDINEGLEAVENAKILLEEAVAASEENKQAKIDRAKVQLEGAKESFDKAKLTLMKYQVSYYLKYAEYRKLYDGVEDYRASIELAIRRVDSGRIEDAISVISASADNVFGN